MDWAFTVHILELELALEEASQPISSRSPSATFGTLKIRSGVAPDHPETKIVTNQFSRVAQNERCSFFGNVSLRSSVSLSELREMYHVVVLSYGAESDRVLGIPGEGNVALDVARILLRPTAELATTDITNHALTALEESFIRHGPVQAACTTKELREVLGIKDLHINIQEADLVKTPADEEELKNSRIQKRVYELLSKAAVSGPSHRSSDQRELHFVFFRKPDGFLDSDDRSGHVVGVRFEKTILKESVGSGKQVAVGTGQIEDLECRSVLVDGLPFDAHKGIVPNVGGRVLINSSGDHTQLEGVYVCGWLKRGPTGIIATNLYCAEETIMSISEDLEKGVLASAPSLPKPGREGLLRLLDQRNVKLIPFSSWEKIDTEESRLGSLKNKPRDKLTTWEELLKVAAKV
ncbi:hypothetical protein ACSBR1_005780 [Camellia fascicularis]